MSKKKNLLLFSFLATAAGITIHLINNSIEEDALNNKHLLKSTITLGNSEKFIMKSMERALHFFLYTI